ncbi:hypothetical protein SUDANB132_00222 [Streptomyces sp. enrichment culture]
MRAGPAAVTPFAVTLTNGNRHGATQLLPLLDAVL